MWLKGVDIILPFMSHIVMLCPKASLFSEVYEGKKIAWHGVQTGIRETVI